jgi:signal transduction histidine kinase
VWLAVPVLAGACVVATITGPFRPAVAVSSFALLSPALATLDVAAGVGLVLAGSLSWLIGRRGSGMLALLAGICWFGRDWAGYAAAPPALRVTGLVLAAFTLPFLAHVVLKATRHDGTRWTRWTLLALYGLTAALAVAWAVVYVPELDPRCFAICRGGAISAYGDYRVARELSRALEVWTIAIGTGMAIWSLARLLESSSRARRAQAPVLVPAIAVGTAWVADAIGSLQSSTDVPPAGPAMVAAFVAQSASVLLLAIGLGWLTLAERRMLLAVRGIASRLTPLPGGGSLQLALAGALADPGLTLAFPVPDGTDLVDADGRRVRPPSGRVTPIDHNGRVVALAIQSTETTPATVSPELGAAVRLAAANESLLAAVRHQVLELRASRARIVEAADAERHRLERDLHDGAQQRMLSVLYELMLARDQAPDDADAIERRGLDRAVEATDAAIDALRVIARGIHHAVLTEAGLPAAMDALAFEAPIPLEVEAPADLRCRDESEAAIWSVVTDALRQAVRLGASGISARLSQAGQSLQLDLSVEGLRAPLDTVSLEDRVGAGGGDLHASFADATHAIRSVLPCG